MANINSQTDLYVNYARAIGRGGNVQREEYKIIDQFDSSYWTGLNLDAYLGTVHVPEIIQLSYQIVETVKPYWGYASYVAHKLHHGSRLVQGEFSLNFKRFGYMFSLLRALRANEDRLSAVPVSTSRTAEGDTFFDNPITYTNQPWGPDSNTKLATNSFTGDALAKYVRSRKRAQFLEEDRVNTYQPTVAHNAGLYEVNDAGFNLAIVFGSNLEQSTTLRWESGTDRYVAQSAVIQDSSVDPHIIGTGLMFTGVSIMSNPVTINDDGRAIMETYSFMARDLRPMTPREIGKTGREKQATEKAVQEAGSLDKRITAGTRPVR